MYPNNAACVPQIAERKKLHQTLMNRLKKEPAVVDVSHADSLSA